MQLWIPQFSLMDLSVIFKGVRAQWNFPF
jgi:hypothetical protein